MSISIGDAEILIKQRTIKKASKADRFSVEIEKDLISARTKEALKARKASGVKLGRPKGPGKSKLDQFRPEIEALLKNGSTQRYIAKRYGCSEANLNNWLSKNKIDKAQSFQN